MAIETGYGHGLKCVRADIRKAGEAVDLGVWNRTNENAREFVQMLISRFGPKIVGKLSPELQEIARDFEKGDSEPVKPL